MSWPRVRIATNENAVANGMKDKQAIVDNWLPRYTGVPLDGFGEHILLTNFGGYLGHFSAMTGAPVVGVDRPMPSATADGITMINFGMGSPNAATVMDLLSAICPKAVLFLGKCMARRWIWVRTISAVWDRTWVSGWRRKCSKLTPHSAAASRRSWEGSRSRSPSDNPSNTRAVNPIRDSPSV